MTKHITPGQKVTRLPAVSLNAAIDAGARMLEFVQPGGPQQTCASGDSPRNVVLIKNMTGQDLKERSIVGIKETGLDLPDITGDPDGDEADQAVLLGEAVDVEKPDPAKHTAGKWGVTLGPIAAGTEGNEGQGWMAIGGLIKARVDVTSDAHAFAVPILNETDHLASADSGTPITWKKTGTGKKWAQINLGAGGGGSTIVWGQLTNTVPANSLLEDLCIERETFDGEGFAFMYGDEEPTPLKVKAWAFNPSLNSGIRGSVGQPLRVFGEMFSVERTEGEETVTHPVFMIMGHQDPLVGAVGFVAAPDNNKGQALIHYDESAATVADGGPCGGA